MHAPVDASSINTVIQVNLYIPEHEIIDWILLVHDAKHQTLQTRSQAAIWDTPSEYEPVRMF